MTGCVTAASRAPSVAATAAAPWPWSLSTAVADSLHTEVISPSMRLYHLSNKSVPWSAAVLDIDLASCVTLRSVKGSATGVGRRTVSDLLTQLSPEDSASAAINADFFSFTPPGIPSGAHVERGRLITGPGDRPVFMVDSSGRASVGMLRVAGSLFADGRSYSVNTWNRPGAGSLNLIDAAWGAPIDTSVPGQGWRLRPAGSDRYVVLGESLEPPTGNEILLVRGRSVAGSDLSLRLGDSVTLRWRLVLRHPMEAVGGFPVLVRDSAVDEGASSAGSASFRGPNPRSVAGIAADGRRLLLAVIDGRRPGVTAGMTLAQTAEFLLALGATEALNLDGGGSSAIVVRDTRTGIARVVTMPSDPTGERAVGNALAVLNRCGNSRI